MLEQSVVVFGVGAVGGEPFVELDDGPVGLVVLVEQLHRRRHTAFLEVLQQEEHVGVEFVHPKPRPPVSWVDDLALLVAGLFAGAVLKHRRVEGKVAEGEFDRDRVDARLHALQGLGVKGGLHQDVASAVLFASSVGDAEEVVAKVRFEHWGVSTNLRLVHRAFKLGHELAAADVLVASALVLRPRIFAVPSGGERHAHFARFDEKPNGVELVARAHFLLLTHLRLHHQLAVAELLWDEGQAVDGDGFEVTLNLGRGGANRLVDFSLHFLGQNLLPNRVVELRLPLCHRLAVFRFKGLQGPKHLHVVRQTPIDFSHDFCVGHFEAVQAGVVEKQLLEQHGLQQPAFVGVCDGAPFQPGLGHAVLDVAGQDNLVADDGHNAVHPLVRRLAAGLGVGVVGHASQGRKEGTTQGPCRPAQRNLNEGARHGSKVGGTGGKWKAHQGQQLTNFHDANRPWPRPAEEGCRAGLRAAVGGALGAGVQ